MIINRLGRDWQWPDGDQKCWPVVFDELIAMRRLTPHLKGRRAAIQAGGNMGVFPWALSAAFDHVLTAEADEDCFRYLIQNVGHMSKVACVYTAFLDRAEYVRVDNDHPNNHGAQFVTPYGGKGIERGDKYVMSSLIDDFGIPDCDLIYLDIEGAELLALKGAQQTIELTKPLICVEEKGLGARYGCGAGDLAMWLSQFGYRAVARSKRDVVYSTV